MTAGLCFVTFIASLACLKPKIQGFSDLSGSLESVDFHGGFLWLSKSGGPKIKEEE